MKISIVGAGARAPLLIPALARRQTALDLQTVILMDTDAQKLELLAPLCRQNLERSGGTFALSWTDDSSEALSGAAAVITTIRVGGEEGRVLDERIALERGVLGQETTGPGGFAMALRTIPAMLGYARQMQQLCPDAWLFNFTNPAGLVTQSLTQELSNLRIVGICDTPSGMHHDVAAAFGLTPAEVPVRFFGLNHLSWLLEATVAEENVVPRLIDDERLAGRVEALTLFDRSLVRLLGVIPNEYLYYYYYRDRAVAGLRAAKETRGRQVQRLGAELLRDLQAIEPAKNPDRAWKRYTQYLDARHDSYLALERGAPARRESGEESSVTEGEGYVGVALDILTAAVTGVSRDVIANVPNRGASPAMADEDVLEVACRCDTAGIHPIPVGDVPEHAVLLTKQVKRYERLTIEAVRQRSRLLAIEALMEHPLVGSYPLARSLVNAYLEVHRDLVGAWDGGESSSDA
jgi:6-phospho-beta-glucosidase